MKISEKQKKKNAELSKIKEALPKECFLCGRPANDLAHLLPRSLFPEYYTEPKNVVILCRQCHDKYDNDISFRQRQKRLYNLAKQVDEKGAMRYFRL